MASVSYSFNLDAVSPAQKQAATSATTESNAAIGAKFDAAQSHFEGASHLSGTSGPACIDGGCFVVHGEGPGVTTLSVGEEDGGVGDYITLPVLDGALFLEPPISDFAGGSGISDPVASTAEYDVTTLAIGEEDGGFAAAPAEIGGSNTVIGTESVERRFTMEPIYDSAPTLAPGVSEVASAPIGVIETTPIVTPIAKPEFAGATIESVQLATANSPLPPIQTVPIVEPRAKPLELAGSSFPLPEIKPEGIFAAASPAAGTSVAGVDTAASTQYVSVGDYDSYLASLGGSETSVASAGESSGSPITVEVAKPDNVYAIYSSPPPAPEAVAQPTTASEIKPATFTTTEPATLPPLQTVPIQTDSALDLNQSATDWSGASSSVQSSTEIGGTFTTVDAPLPSGKPEGIAGDAPRLSDEDFRISTLALGEEESGGG